MSTLVNSTTGQVTTELQSLIAGDRNIFIFLPDDKSEGKIKESKVAKFLSKLHSTGYGIDNAYEIFDLSKDDFKRFKNEFGDMVDSTTKDGMIFRKTFAESEEMVDYTEEEWMAIFAQYSITYGWSDKYQSKFGTSAENVLGDYVDSMSDEIAHLKGNKIRTMSVGGAEVLVPILRKIVESPAVLRTQQIKTLEAVPANILAKASDGAKITIKETLIKVMGLTSGYEYTKPLLKSATDVIRFIAGTMAHTPVEGILSKSVLNNTKIRIPVSMRKTLLRNLELIAQKHTVSHPKKLITNSGPKYLTEDMFAFDKFWKQVDKYLRYEKSAKSRLKYPLYTTAIDLLYANDRSWTFNSRFEKAKDDLDYSSAVAVAAERSGVLMRNLLQFLRMTKGTKMPVKKGSGRDKPSNPFQEKLNKAKKGSTSNDMIVRTDATEFLKSDDFSAILDRNLNPKLAWQLVEQLKDEDLLKPTYKRTVQGVTIEYSTPIPGVDPKLAKSVRKQVLGSLKTKLQDRNKDVGKVFIDDDSKSYMLQFSGRSSTEVSFAGEFLSPGSELDLLDIIGSTDVENPILRLGVMWRSTKEKNQSIDIDHSVTLVYGSREDHVYYGEPTAKNGAGHIIASSSGDITSCGNHDGMFSTELVDIDVIKMGEAGVKKAYNSLIDFGGSVSVGSLECYLFFTIIDKSNRVNPGTKVKVDLAQMDYAIRIDPDNSDNTGSYIGVLLDIENNLIKVLSAPIKLSGAYTNAKVNNQIFNDTIADLRKPLTIDYALKKALGDDKMTRNINDASLIISRKTYSDMNFDAKILHPGRDAEEVNKMLF